LAVFGLAAPAAADTIKVKNEKDAGKGSLRKAIADSADGDRVVVPKGVYKLKSGPLQIDTDIEVQGAGSSKTVIDAQKKSGVIEVSATAGPIQLSKLAVTNGKADFAGAGINNFGDLTLDKVLVSKNQAGVIGGGIDTNGSLQVVASKITRNKVVTDAVRGYGGGISSPTATGPVELVRSSVTRNTVTAHGDDASGGGIMFGPTGGSSKLRVYQSTIADNTASGDLRGYGAGIAFTPFVSGGVNMPLEIVESTISGNRALGQDDYSFGGGIYFEPLASGAGTTSALTLENSTVANNLVQVDTGTALGGGVFLAPLVSTGGATPQTFTNSTIAGNDAAGMASEGGGVQVAQSGDPPTAANIIVADNIAATGTNCSDPLESDEGNLEDVSTCGFTLPNDVGPADPELRSLGDYGGPTQTLAIPEESPAVDQGLSGNCLSTDQRGVDRPRGAFCDIGAFEFEQP
jgi:hypothetical protein